MRDIGKNIKTMRQAKGMTQEAMADALYVTRQTVSNYENGRSRPDLDMLLQIAQVLETDVNTILYGPVVPRSKKNAYKWAAISLGVLFVSWIAYFSIIAAFPTHGTYAGYIFCIRIFNKETFLPLGMFVLGWCLLHMLSLLTGLQQINHPKIRIGKIVMLVVGCIAVLIPLPYNIWLIVVAVRSYTSSFVSMSFPYIPIYQQMYQGIIYVIYHAPFVYAILGGLFWLFGLPSIKQKICDAVQVDE